MVKHAQSAGEVVDGEAAVQPGQAMNHGRIEIAVQKMCGGAPVNKQKPLGCARDCSTKSGVGRVGCDRLARLDLNGNKSDRPDP